MPEPFISVEQWLDLREEDGREFWHFAPAPYWLQWYKVAKASYEKWGPEGPPVGTKVITLRAGFGGPALIVRTFKGIFDRDPRFFVLEYIDTQWCGQTADRACTNPLHDTQHVRQGISWRSTWWRDFCVKEDYPNGKPLPRL
jgi:hypothetical protein